MVPDKIQIAAIGSKRIIAAILVYIFPMAYFFFDPLAIFLQFFLWHSFFH